VEVWRSSRAKVGRRGSSHRRGRSSREAIGVDEPSAIAEAINPAYLAHEPLGFARTNASDDDAPMIDTELVSSLEHGADLKMVCDIDVLIETSTVNSGSWCDMVLRRAHLGGPDSHSRVATWDNAGKVERDRLVLVEDSESRRVILQNRRQLLQSRQRILYAPDRETH
jgi:hypothetical protein